MYKKYIAADMLPRCSKNKIIYVIRCQSEKLFKVGQTTDLKNRLSKIQTDCPHTIETIFSVKGCNATEKCLQRILNDYQLRESEWFLSPINNIEKFISNKIIEVFGDSEIKNELAIKAPQ